MLLSTNIIIDIGALQRYTVLVICAIRLERKEKLKHNTLDGMDH